VRSSLLLKFGMGARFRVLNELKKLARNSRLAFSPSTPVVGKPNCFARLKSTCLKLGPGNELRPIGGPPRGNAVVKQLSIPAPQFVSSVGKLGSLGALPGPVVVVGRTPLMNYVLSTPRTCSAFTIRSLISFF
jgi:hypothetical protein